MVAVSVARSILHLGHRALLAVGERRGDRHPGGPGGVEGRLVHHRERGRAGRRQLPGGADLLAAAVVARSRAAVERAPVVVLDEVAGGDQDESGDRARIGRRDYYPGAARGGANPSGRGGTGRSSGSRSATAPSMSRTSTRKRIMAARSAGSASRAPAVPIR